MNARERFVRVTRGKPIDRIFHLEEPIRKEVLERWYAEGLSRQVTVDTCTDFFNLDPYANLNLPLTPAKGSLRSAGEFRKLERHYRRQRADFQQCEFWRRKAEEFARRDYPLGVMGWRGFMQPLFTHDREWESLQEVLLALHDYPGQVKSALDLVASCYIEIIELASKYLSFDFGVISEPIASRAGPVISPSMFEEFLLPSYRKIVDCFHGLEIKPVIYRSWCNVVSVIPLALQADVDGLWIGQSADLIDYVELRQKYPDLLLIGGIDADVLSTDREAIRREVTAKVPDLLRSERYLPTIDDNPRENVPYRNYKFYRRFLREVCEQQ